MSEDKFKILRVTMTADYFIEMIDDQRTKINGWTLEKVIEEWFEKYPLGLHHASRDGCKIGNSRQFIKSEIVEEYPKK